VSFPQEQNAIAIWLLASARKRRSVSAAITGELVGFIRTIAHRAQPAGFGETDRGGTNLREGNDPRLDR
jgi:hypothetical protein